MGLLPEINEEETIENVRYYFEHDFPRLVAQSHINLNYIQSPSFDSMGGGTSVRNSQEDKIVGKISAKEYVALTMRLISNFPREYKIIIKNGFINHQDNYTLCDGIGCSTTKLNDLKKKALLYFADAFQEFEDLHIYPDSFKKGQMAFN